ncbi:hypothetical protein [Plantibacter sp. YIM 135347]|uniref:hypothetical protein n=1 Tax=Plantibacter sp. YIM 135347 TaxID=3423919 RepID=UPI003D32BA76
MSDFESTNGPVRVRVEGLRKTVRALEKSGADASDMRELMHAIGNIVVRAASPPVLDGTLAGTIRAGKGKTKAVVRAGGARAPYAGVIHYGYPARNLAARPFLSIALQAERSDVLQALDKGLKDIQRKNDL